MIKLPVRDLARKKIADGHVYLSGTEGRKFYLLKPGMLLDEDFIKKHAQLNTIFEFEPVLNNEVHESFTKLFKELRYFQFDKDLKNQGLKISKEFHKVYSAEEHFFSFAQAAFDTFSLIPHDVLKKIHTVDTKLFRKAFYSAAFSVITAITNDFYNFVMLRDFYNITFLMDFGLCDADYSYYVAQACNQENKLPGSGRSWLAEVGATDKEMRTYLEHPKKSYSYVVDTGILGFTELAQAVMYQHELSNGKGFPRGIPRSFVSSWEAVIIFADSLVEISDSFTFESRVIEHMTQFQNSKLRDLPVHKVQHRLKEVLNYFEHNDEESVG